MPDLAAYVARVLEEQDRILLCEASACYAAGANRAAYITIWLATAESLRRKFVEAAVKDHRASAILSQIQRQEGSHRAVDAMLIEKAKEYGFVTDAEALRLRHLYENRNVFGHPYEQRPSDQLVETAASESTDIVLGRPVALREGYLSQQITRLTSDRAFLSDDRIAVEEYAMRVHAQSAPNLRLWFVRKSLKMLDPVFADQGSDQLQRRNQWFFRIFLLCDNRIFDEWDVVDDLPDHPAILPELLATRELFVLVSDHARDIIVNELILASRIDSRHIEPIWELQESGVLVARHRELLSAAVRSTELSRLAGGGLPLLAFWERIVDGLRTYSWVPQNEAVAVLRAAGPDQIASLEAAAQESLGRNIMQAAEGTAFSAQNLLGELSVVASPWPLNFIAGIVLEPFVAEDGSLRLKVNQMKSALLVLRSLSPTDREAIVERLIAGAETGRVRYPLRFRADCVRAVENVRAVATMEDLQALERLAIVLGTIEADDEERGDG